MPKSPLGEATLFIPNETACRIICSAAREIGGGSCARKDHIGMY